MQTGGQIASSSGSGGGGAGSDPTSPPSGSAAERATDGWDNEEWGSLEEEPVSVHKCKNLHNLLKKHTIKQWLKTIKYTYPLYMPKVSTTFIFND